MVSATHFDFILLLYTSVESFDLYKPSLGLMRNWISAIPFGRFDAVFGWGNFSLQMLLKKVLLLYFLDLSVIQSDMTLKMLDQFEASLVPCFC